MLMARRMRWARTALVLAASISSAGLAVVAAPPAGTATSGGSVSVVLDEWKLVPSLGAVRSGRITFVVRNDGSMPHEFVALRSDRRAGALPLKGGKAVETGRLGKLPRIASGASRRLTLSLRPGRYVLICNLMGHYQAGQFAALRVR
jgi:uncharacterized cupredoxin-like copper-binding protein